MPLGSISFACATAATRWAAAATRRAAAAEGASPEARVSAAAVHDARPRSFGARAASCFVSIALFAAAAGCSRKYRVGDHVLVEWRGGEYPGVITAVETGAKFRVHYDGFSEDWDEIVPSTRVLERLPSSAAPLGPRPWPTASAPASASATASAAPRPPPPRDLYRVGDRVRVEWHGALYGATVVATPEPDSYRVHYDGYGDEWDETVAASRIQRNK